jgi:hypothetical protein
MCWAIYVVSPRAVFFSFPIVSRGLVFFTAARDLAYCALSLGAEGFRREVGFAERVCCATGWVRGAVIVGLALLFLKARLHCFFFLFSVSKVSVIGGTPIFRLVFITESHVFEVLYIGSSSADIRLCIIRSGSTAKDF